MDLFGGSVDHIIATWGYWAVAGIVGLESTGIPAPGETVLIAAALYAGSTGHLSIVLVIVAAAVGGIVGDNIGYVVGREVGFRLLRRWGHYIRLDQKKLKLGQYLFLRYGGAIVFFGRFVAVLRAWSAFLAGADGMAWPRFFLWNAAGVIAWAIVWGLGSWAIGTALESLTGPIGIVLAVVVVLLVIAGWWYFRRNEARLEEEAERALPGPLRVRRPKPARPAG